MKRHWKHLVISSALMLCGACCAIPMQAANPEEETWLERDGTLDDMSISELLSSVKTGKYKEMIQTFQHKEAVDLLNMKVDKQTLYNTKDGFRVETIRNKEVIILTIPTDMLFLPNDTQLMHGADKYLNPLKRFLRKPDMYRMLLIMHTDNTGSAEYTDQLAMDRVDAVFTWLVDQGCNTSRVFPTASGSADPLLPNTSGENRARNRRLEVYLIPGEEMMKQAKNGRIAL